MVTSVSTLCFIGLITDLTYAISAYTTVFIMLLLFGRKLTKMHDKEYILNKEDIVERRISKEQVMEKVSGRH
ncbi:hypothetical protein V6R21_30310 [Limibacter armeniacum]|uniref:hypothetical protein n=1 Tax=Limibacter armeniacum TaxID=466084 RepID=UPI002FE56916